MEWSTELSGGLLRAMPDAVLVLDAGRIVLANERAEELFGWAAADLRGRSADVLLTESSRTEVPGTSWQRHAGTSGPVAATMQRRDGSTFPAESSVSRVETPHGCRVVVVIRDLTEQRRAETERARLCDEADTHRSQRLESLGQLAGGIAHDFNNLLGVIVNYTNFVIEEASSQAADLAAIAADARQVLKAGERGTDLTHRLLAFARREVVRPRVLDLNEVVAGAREAVRQAIGEHLQLIVRLGDRLPPVSCDPAQIEQMLVNLAVNARDAMPSGGRLVIDTERFQAEPGGAVPAGDYVRLRVADSGCGMPAEVTERACEPFFTTKGSGSGTGLGLATVYGIVTQAEGQIHLASEPGVGTTVTVLLPAGSAEPAAAAPVPEPAARAGQGETLLVVEDESALREVAGRILSAAGYRVIAADSGPHALELAARHHGDIDLLVSDVVMPGMLGKELAERLVGQRPATRVLFMSGYAQPVLASHGTLEPGVALLEKPFTAAGLLSAVRRRLDG
ncbi:ATP-binding protein [Mangrovihabitans endophyticus]|uniref:histidine kinase n=1 Tax=Mangrovihabitans endophyticus TaxID=1751298 RepID=A0A8J3FR54_9ACTN|nr:ATP-binding protein [Mangrovihabitans endophyticus]GGL14711.1 hypothetical protein GCM10012284_56810 [Mangrovihabitans endophyticus]